MIDACAGQLRAGMGGPYALDFGAVMAMGAARDVDTALLADVLPAVEAAILSDSSEEGDDG